MQFRQQRLVEEGCPATSQMLRGSTTARNEERNAALQEASIWCATIHDSGAAAATASAGQSVQRRAGVYRQYARKIERHGTSDGHQHEVAIGAKSETVSHRHQAEPRAWMCSVLRTEHPQGLASIVSSTR